MAITTPWRYPSFTRSGATLSGHAAGETVAWTNSSLISADDGAMATASVSPTAFSLSLRAFGFSFIGIIPANATILGIEVDIKRKRGADAAADHKVYLVSDGSVNDLSGRIGTNKATATAWPTTLTSEIHGGPSDLWGASLTQPALGALAVDVQVKGTGAGATVASIDYVAMRVTYDLPPISGTLSVIEAADTLASSSSYVPALDLDLTTGLDSRITFTRGSTATRVNASGLIETVASGAPRFDYDPVSLLPKGLLIEEQRTNIALQSGSAAASPWSNYTSGSGVTPVVTANYGPSPDGGTNAARIQLDCGSTASGSNRSGRQQAVATSLGVAYAVSFWIKATSAGEVGKQLRVTAGSLAATTTTLPAEWTRIVLTGTDPVGNMQLLFETRGTVTTNQTADFLLWGLQVEAGAFATSYIPTVASQVTRSADVASMTGASFSSWFNAVEGAFIVEADQYAVNAGDKYAVHVDDATANNRYIIGTNGTASALYAIAGGANQAVFSIGTAVANALNRIALGYKANDFAGCLNGSSVGTDALGTLPAVTTLRLGCNTGGAGYLNGHIRRLRYYNVRLPNTVLRALTTTISGTLTATEAADTLSAAGALHISASLSVTEAADDLTATGEVGWPAVVPPERIAAAPGDRLAGRIAVAPGDRIANRTA